MLTDVDLTILMRAALAALLGFVIGGERRPPERQSGHEPSP